LQEMKVPQLIYGSWVFEQWEMTAWHLVQVSEICKWTGPVRHLVMAQSSQRQDEELLTPFWGEAARWG